MANVRRIFAFYADGALRVTDAIFRPTSEVLKEILQNGVYMGTFAESFGILTEAGVMCVTLLIFHSVFVV